MSFKLYPLKNYYIITDIKEHVSIKKKLLKYFDDLPDKKHEHISKTDWDKKEVVKLQPGDNYKRYMIQKIRPYYDKIAKRLGFKLWGWKIRGMWFQIYNNNDYHNWHNHMYCNWSNIYYVKLPNKSMVTQLYDSMDKKPMSSIKVKEGQMLTFPANIMHRSPKNDSNDSKIIVSFNSDILIEKGKP